MIETSAVKYNGRRPASWRAAIKRGIRPANRSALLQYLTGRFRAFLASI